MDGIDFDTLVKTLTTRLTRLQILRGLVVGAVAATISFVAPDETDAKCKKQCDQCQKKVKKKTKSGKVRCKCQPKANGTPCSIPGATTATTCLNGTCVAAATPAPVPAVCTRNQPCTGANAGLICNAQGTACVACTSYTQCPAVTVAGFALQQACLSGRCLGGEACKNDPDCFAPLRCDNPTFSDAFCLLADDCEKDDDCVGDKVCVAGQCLDPCVGPGANCDANFTCEGFVCIPD